MGSMQQDNRRHVDSTDLMISHLDIPVGTISTSGEAAFDSEFLYRVKGKIRSEIRKHEPHRTKRTVNCNINERIYRWGFHGHYRYLNELRIECVKLYVNLSSC